MILSTFLSVLFVFNCDGSNDLNSLVSNISRVDITTSDNALHSDTLQHITFTGHKDSILNDSTDIFQIKCFDLHRNCFEWSIQGECDINPLYMHEKCAHSCKTCSEQSMEFRYENCENKWEINGNNEDDCYRWANEGYCQTDTFMKLNCQRSCNFCSFDDRCQPEIEYESALNLNNYTNPDLYFRLFFNRILSNKFFVWKYGIKLMNIDPPILYFDHIIPESIADKFIIENQNESYKRSVDVVGTNNDGSIYMSESQGRTSINAWCGDTCQSKNSTQILLNSMQEITGIPKTYYENLQMLIYNKTGYYHYHHDFIESQADGIAGGRILTFFVYLNNVNIGGETKFPQLKLKVKPKKGAAILWPNVMNNDMKIKNDKTHHTALPVIDGVKYGVNAWIHLHDWEHATNIDCTS